VFCPNCSTEVEDYSDLEGGYCQKCDAWFPLDIIQDAIDEL